MMYYNLMFILIGISNFLKIKKNFLYCSIVFSFFLLSFLRWESGTDWDSYYNIFINLDFTTTNDILYKYLNVVIRKITINYNIFLFILACILYLFKYSTVYKYSEIPLLSLLMIFCYSRGDIFFVRQTIASAITLFSVRYVLEKKKKNFLFCIILATGFHKTAIVFLIIYCINFINIRKIKRKHYVFLIIFAMILSTKIKDIILYIANYLPVEYSKKIFRYVWDNNNNFGYRSWMPFELVITVSLINRFLILFIFICFYKKIKNDQNKKLFIIYYLSVIFYFLFKDLGNLLRIVNYFSLLEVILLPNLVKEFKKNKKTIYILLYGYLYLKLLLGLSSYYNEYVPVKLILGLYLI